MSLITLDELARGAIILTFGGAAGACTIAFPGSALWLLPAGLCVGGCALTVPEIRREVALLLPDGTPRRLLDAPADALRAMRRAPSPSLAAEIAADDTSAAAWGRPAPSPRDGLRPAPQPRTEEAPRSRPRWLQAINGQPDQRPHTLITGPTRSGKTTLATAAIADRGGRAVVITPKVNPSNWSGAEVITLDDEGGYGDIQRAIADIDDEKRERIGRLRRGEPLEPLTIVYDELGELAAFAPEAPEQMTQLSSIGAELKMRVIGIGTSDDALGIKRWKATRNNYVRVEMDADRRATINDGVRAMTAQPRESVAMAQAARLRPWRGEPAPAPRRAVAADAPRAASVSIRVPAPSPDAVLAGLMAELPADVRAAVPDLSPERAERLARALKSVTARQDAVGTAERSVPVPDANGDGNGTGTRSEVTMTPGTGEVRVIVDARATAETPSRRRVAGRGLDMKKRRQRAESHKRATGLDDVYRKAGAEGRSFRSTFAEHGGSKDPAFRAWQEGKAGRA